MENNASKNLNVSTALPACRESVPGLREPHHAPGAEVAEPEREAYSADPSDRSISSLSSSFSSMFQRLSSSSSSSRGSILSLSPPLPPSVELSAIMTDTRLTLDVYLGGAATLPLAWGYDPDHLRGIKYLRLGSEDKPGLDAALDVLPHMTGLHSLAIRGNISHHQHISIHIAIFLYLV